MGALDSNDVFIIDSGLKIYQVMTPRMGKHCTKYLRWHKMLFMMDLHENIFFSCLKILVFFIPIIAISKNYV